MAPRTWPRAAVSNVDCESKQATNLLLSCLRGAVKNAIRMHCVAILRLPTSREEKDWRREGKDRKQVPTHILAPFLIIEGFRGARREGSSLTVTAQTTCGRRVTQDKVPHVPGQ